MNYNVENDAISITNLSKYYSNELQALKNINLNIKRGEIFALLGANGAGKTTLIGSICGTLKFNTGNINILGHDNMKDYRITRSHIGLVPQELTTSSFETVWDSVSFSRELFGKSANPQYIQEVLEKLSLWDKKDYQIRKLSGGMKRRVMIAKALSHEPDILFLDEPSSGVDVELRKSMWQQIHDLNEKGVTIILTTHYIQEAEEMANRIGVINKGELLIVERKKTLMKKLGKKKVIITLSKKLKEIPISLSKFKLELSSDKTKIIFNYNSDQDKNNVVTLLDQLKENKISYKDLETHRTSLEEIYVQLVKA